MSLEACSFYSRMHKARAPAHVLLSNTAQAQLSLKVVNKKGAGDTGFYIAMYVCKPSVVSQGKAVWTLSPLASELALCDPYCSLWLAVASISVLHCFLTILSCTQIELCHTKPYNESLRCIFWKACSFITLPLCPDFPSNAPSYAPRTRSFPTLCPRSSLDRKRLIYTFQRQTNSTLRQDSIMEREQRRDEKKTEKNNKLSARSH